MTKLATLFSFYDTIFVFINNVSNVCYDEILCCIIKVNLSVIKFINETLTFNLNQFANQNKLIIKLYVN